MTTPGLRPFLAPSSLVMSENTFSFTNYNLTSYADQRYQRLLESVDEYLTEEQAGSKLFLDDLQKALLELRQYHDNVVDNFTHVQDFFQ